VQLNECITLMATVYPIKTYGISGAGLFFHSPVERPSRFAGRFMALHS
jgi:hypothetical protein